MAPIGGADPQVTRGEKGFEIWQRGDRIHSIDNPVRLEILRHLGEGPKNLAQLVLATGRAKSTLSAIHLPPLVEGGLVEEVPVPEDNRTKRYRLVGERLGRSDVEVPRLKNAVLEFAKRQGVDGGHALDLVDPLSLASSGASRAYLEAVADRLGAAIGDTLPAGVPRCVLALSDVLAQRKLGRIRVAPEGIELECAPALMEFLTSFTRRALSKTEARGLRIRTVMSAIPS